MKKIRLHTDGLNGVSQKTVDTIRSQAAADIAIELDVFPGTMTVGNKGERPRRPYLMMAVDGGTDFLLGVELLSTDGTIESLWEQVPATFCQMMAESELRPRLLAIRAQWLAGLLEPVCAELGIEIIRAAKLPALQRARRSLERFEC